MSQPESGMRRRVIRALDDHGLDPVAVENSVCPGTPDINWRNGWIELKQIKEWPKRVDTIVSLPLFTPQQRIWIARRVRKGGRVHLLLRVGTTEWLLFDGLTAAQQLGKLTRSGMELAAVGWWPNRLNDGELVYRLCQ